MQIDSETSAVRAHVKVLLDGEVVHECFWADDVAGIVHSGVVGRRAMRDIRLVTPDQEAAIAAGTLAVHQGIICDVRHGNVVFVFESEDYRRIAEMKQGS